MEWVTAVGAIIMLIGMSVATFQMFKTNRYIDAEAKRIGDRLDVMAGRLAEEDIVWIVNNKGELGVEVRGTPFFMWKGESASGTYDEHGATLYRKVKKREFGEVIRPDNWTFDENDNWTTLEKEKAQ